MELPPFPFVREHEVLAPYTLYRIGGPARMAFFPTTSDEVATAYRWIRDSGLPWIVLGGGSNVLVDDSGYPGAVIFTTELQQLHALGDDRFRVGSGVVLDALLQDVMLPHNYAGVGGLTGVPGTVGGAIFMNAGTVNGSACQLLETVDVLKADGVHRITMEPSLYSYRGQSFCTPGDVILEGLFRFEPADTPQQPIFDHYIQRRREKQPQGWCCGSVFKNPDGDHAGRLIESCGLKGTRHGGAVISPLHANFIMNEANACASDVLALIALAKEHVREQFGVELEEEVRIIRSPTAAAA